MAACASKTVDGQNPAPIAMAEALEILGETRIIYLPTGAGFRPSTKSHTRELNDWACRELSFGQGTISGESVPCVG